VNLVTLLPSYETISDAILTIEEKFSLFKIVLHGLFDNGQTLSNDQLKIYLDSFLNIFGLNDALVNDFLEEFYSLDIFARPSVSSAILSKFLTAEKVWSIKN